MKFSKTLALGLTTLMMSVNVFANDATIIVNGTPVDGTTYTENNTNYLPLRSIAESLGFSVEWNGTNKSIVLSNLPQYVTMTVGVDGYTFAKTAAMPLGSAPIIKDGTTYVPESLFTDLLSYNVEKTDDAVVISEIVSGSAKVVSVEEDGILVEDAELGQVKLIPSEDTVITDTNGEAKTLADITVDTDVVVEYGDIMTSSLPPINNPKSITIA